MFVFVDEAGDTGLKFDRGSSRYFTIAIVIFIDEKEMQACDRSIDALRRNLGKPANFEFHFHDNSRRVRGSFISAVSGFDFVFHAFALRKDALTMRGEGFGAKEPFYKSLTAFVFDDARAYLKDAYVIVDKSGSRDFHGALAKYVKGTMNTPGNRVIRKFRAERSSQNNLLQLADYVVGICHRRAMGTADADMYYRPISAKKVNAKKK